MARTCPKCGAPRTGGTECPQCGVIYAKAEQQEYQSKREQGPSSKPPPMTIPTRSALTLDCTACKTSASMEKKSVNRFPLFIRLIGLVIATPSAVGMLVGAITMFQSRGYATTGVETMGFFVGGGFVMLSAVGGLIGWLLLMRKKAWVCSRCGYMLDRA